MVRTVAQQLDAAAREQPENIVLVGPSGDLTWRQLDVRAGAVAESLLDDGINPGDRIAIATEDIIDTGIGIIAGLKVGAAITPMNPRLSDSDRRAILDVLKPARVVGHAG